MTEKLSKPKQKKSSYEEERIKCKQKILNFKLPCEANIVCMLFKNPDLFYQSNLKLEDFSHNEWKVYFSIGNMIVNKENKPMLDDITIGIYLERHLKLKEKYEEYGGYATITKAKEYVDEANFDGYIKDLNKWNVILKLLDNGFPITDKLSDFADYTIEEIYDEYELLLNHTFINAETSVKSYDISDGLHELIDELNEGVAVGLPYSNLNLLSKETGGLLEGNVTLIGGVSNAGKSSFIRNVLLPTIIEKKSKIVCILNEEDEKRWKRELLIFVTNNIFHKDIQKYLVRNGNYNNELLEILKESAEWIRVHANNNTITVVPLDKYSTKTVKKLINKYSSLGVTQFVLDTFKFDGEGSKLSEQIAKMAQDMVDLYNTVKPKVKNVHLTCTFQLTKASSKQRYLTMDNTGVSKNIFDPISTGIMIRNFLPDEYTGEKNELKVYKVEGKNGMTKIPVHTKPEQHLQILFIVKNRDGRANEYQIVVESDLSKNIIKEVGICNVPVDF